MHPLKKAHIKRQFLLTDPTVGAQPAPQQRPKPFHGVAVDLTVPITVIIPCIFPFTVVDHVVYIAPIGQFVIDGVLVRVD